MVAVKITRYTVTTLFFTCRQGKTSHYDLCDCVPISSREGYYSSGLLLPVMLYFDEVTIRGGLLNEGMSVRGNTVFQV